ncbi:hypothetical protein ACQ86N_17420 [Puia sp. P3]|uniref:hypothetical protein n=1 Tax=Puia sp. P3 TaxID=3423952 RepID=UPI003D6704A5
MKLNATQTLGILLLFGSTQVFAKTPGRDGVRWQAHASRKEGLIGVTAASPVDNPADNSFHVYLQSPLKAGQRVWLTYDLDGVQDYTAVSRSINDQLVDRRLPCPQTTGLAAPARTR